MKTVKELDLRPVGKVIIFRDRQTNKTFLLYIDWPGSTSIGNYHSLIKILLETPQEIFSPQQSGREASDLAVEILTLTMRVLSKQTNYL